MNSPVCAQPWVPAPPLSGHPTIHASSSRHLLCLGTDPLPPPGMHPSHAASSTGERSLLSEVAVKVRCGYRNLWEHSPDASLQPPASPVARSFPVCLPHELGRTQGQKQLSFPSFLPGGPALPRKQQPLDRHLHLPVHGRPLRLPAGGQGQDRPLVTACCSPHLL